MEKWQFTKSHTGSKLALACDGVLSEAYEIHNNSSVYYLWPVLRIMPPSFALEHDC